MIHNIMFDKIFTIVLVILIILLFLYYFDIELFHLFLLNIKEVIAKFKLMIVDITSIMKDLW